MRYGLVQVEELKALLHLFTGCFTHYLSDASWVVWAPFVHQHERQILTKSTLCKNMHAETTRCFATNH